MKRCWVLVAAVLGLLMVTKPVYAGPPPAGATTEQYEQWVKDQYLPSKRAEGERMEAEIAGQVEGWASGNQEPDNWMGTTEGQAQSNAEWDELNIKNTQFPMCNDYRITVWGDPERRPPLPCQQELGFFDRPNAISFMCPFGIFGNACGSDPATGFELQLLCASDPGACGLHYDNKHLDTGGVRGIGIITREPAPPLSPCTNIYTTASYVEYQFPWVMLNTSRQMYQSSYLVKDVSEEMRRLGHDQLKDDGSLETGATIDLVAESGNNSTMALSSQNVGSALPKPNAQRDEITRMAAQALDRVDVKLRDISPHSSRQYTRNFSSVMDIRFQQTVYWYVPHYPLDTHRFGTEFPDMPVPVDIPMPTGTYENLELSAPGGDWKNRGGLLHSRFLSMSYKSEGKLGDNTKELIKARSPFRCIANNKATGRTPSDFLPMIASGSGSDPFCIDKIGPRFPLTSLSFSPHNTDAFWRGITSGGLDLFYALNWPELYGADASTISEQAKISPMGQQTPFHTYLEDYDRIALSPNPESSDPNFASEVTQCGTIKDIADYNVNYLKSNLHKPLWGAQNTAYVYGVVKGLWGFRGHIAMYELLFCTGAELGLERRLEIEKKLEELKKHLEFLRAKPPGTVSEEETKIYEDRIKFFEDGLAGKFGSILPGGNCSQYPERYRFR